MLRPSENLLDDYLKQLKQQGLTFLGQQPTMEDVQAYQVVNIINNRALTVRQ